MDDRQRALAKPAEKLGRSQGVSASPRRQANANRGLRDARQRRQSHDVPPAHTPTNPDDRHDESTGNSRQGVWNSPVLARNPHAPGIRAEDIHISRHRALGFQAAAGGSGLGRLNFMAAIYRSRSSSAFHRSGAEDSAESESRHVG